MVSFKGWQIRRKWLSFRTKYGTLILPDIQQLLMVILGFAPPRRSIVGIVPSNPPLAMGAPIPKNPQNHQVINVCLLKVL
jgi:hypothetical protein